MYARALALTAVLAVSPFVSDAFGEDSMNDLERFQLFANCEPMNLVVEGLQLGAAEFGLSVEQIRAAAESRLRSARIYDSGSLAYLYINVNTAGSAFSINISYRKPMLDIASEFIWPAETWNASSTGTHGRDAGYILSGISRHLDVFLADFLRVNEEACTNR